MRKIKAIIFDMDGVLIDAKDWHYEALNKALRIFGMEISRHDHLVTYDGLPTTKKLEILSIERSLPRDLHELINAIKQKYTMEIIWSRCRPLFQHEYALFKLKSEGYRLVVCSNAVRDTVEAMMEKSKLMDYLEFCLSNQDITKPKPDPEIYLKAIDRLGVKPEECLILEDNINGIKAAIASGAHVMEIQYVDDVYFDMVKKRISEVESRKIDNKVSIRGDF